MSFITFGGYDLDVVSQDALSITLPLVRSTSSTKRSSKSLTYWTVQLQGFEVGVARDSINNMDDFYSQGEDEYVQISELLCNY